MESREEGPSHDPDDVRGGGGTGGGPGKMGQEEWRQREETRKAEEARKAAEREPGTGPGAGEEESRG